MRSRRLVGRTLIPAALLFLLLTGTVAAQPRNYRAHLSGGEEVPPVAVRSQGQAVFQLNKDGTELSYRLIVANISGITQAHIHCGVEGANGPVVAFLFNLVPAGVTMNGVLQTGVVTDADVIARPDDTACPGGVANFDEMMARIESGTAYVNVHTTTFPAGQIRGQIR
jgi:hypothetical protein